eukprot:364220-Chlamydomonas_euryale.AAC.7
MGRAALVADGVRPVACCERVCGKGEQSIANLRASASCLSVVRRQTYVVALRGAVRCVAAGGHPTVGGRRAAVFNRQVPTRGCMYATPAAAAAAASP